MVRPGLVVCCTLPGRLLRVSAESRSLGSALCYYVACHGFIYRESQSCWLSEWLSLCLFRYRRSVILHSRTPFWRASGLCKAQLQKTRLTRGEAGCCNTQECSNAFEALNGPAAQPQASAHRPNSYRRLFPCFVISIRHRPKDQGPASVGLGSKLSTLKRTASGDLPPRSAMTRPSVRFF